MEAQENKNKNIYEKVIQLNIQINIILCSWVACKEQQLLFYVLRMATTNNWTETKNKRWELPGICKNCAYDCWTETSFE